MRRLTTLLLAAAALITAAPAHAYEFGLDGDWFKPGPRVANPIPRTTVTVVENYPAGTILVNTAERRLYLMTGNGRSRYHALQLSLAGRKSGLQYLASYDYSYCRDNGSSSVARATDQGTSKLPPEVEARGGTDCSPTSARCNRQGTRPLPTPTRTARGPPGSGCHRRL